MNAVKKILVVGGILLLPGIFYLVLIRGENHYKHLAIFGPREAAPGTVAGQADTVYHTVADFSLTDQDGHPLTRDAFRDKFVVADFFFATCQTICPKMSRQLVRVQEAFAGDSDVVILSHTVNPAQDTVEALKAYAREYGAVEGKWYFVTGDKKTIYELARNSYFLPAVEAGDGGPGDFIHSDQFVLLDKEKRIRGYYDGTDPAEVDRLIDEIKVLKLEYAETKP